jgi:hypothetical protein
LTGMSCTRNNLCVLHVLVPASALSYAYRWCSLGQPHPTTGLRYFEASDPRAALVLSTLDPRIHFALVHAARCLLLPHPLLPPAARNLVQARAVKPSYPPTPPPTSLSRPPPSFHCPVPPSCPARAPCLPGLAPAPGVRRAGLPAGACVLPREPGQRAERGRPRVLRQQCGYCARAMGHARGRPAGVVPLPPLSRTVVWDSCRRRSAIYLFSPCLALRELPRTARCAGVRWVLLWQVDVDGARGVVTLSKIWEWYGGDFGPDLAGVLAWISARLPEAKRAALAAVLAAAGCVDVVCSSAAARGAGRPSAACVGVSARSWDVVCLWITLSLPPPPPPPLLLTGAHRTWSRLRRTTGQQISHTSTLRQWPQRPAPAVCNCTATPASPHDRHGKTNGGCSDTATTQRGAIRSLPPSATQWGARRGIRVVQAPAPPRWPLTDCQRRPGPGRRA